DRQWQDQARRRLDRWRRQLADRAAACSGAVESADEIHAALALGWPARAFGIARDRRDGLRAAAHRRTTQATRNNLCISQQFDPDLAGETGRERVRCPAHVSFPQLSVWP